LTTVDLIFDLPKFPIEDSKNTAHRHLMCAGGPASNAAVAFAYLGGKARLISAVGEAAVGRIAKDDFVEHEVAHVDLRAGDKSPPILSTIVVSGDSGARTIVTSPADDRSAVGVVDVTLDRSTNIVLFDGYESDLAVDAARRARALGVTTVFDGDIYRPSLEKLLGHIDVAIFGQTFRTDPFFRGTDISGYFRKFGVSMIAETYGAAAIRFTDGDSTGEISVPASSVVDTLGAGDIFHGAFCYYHARGAPFESALISASKVAAASVGSFGTRNWMNEFKRDHFD
jgi:sugar/nucleoside kinase (ribokinase family)